MDLNPLFNRPPYHDPNPATMFIVSLVPLPGAPMHPVCNPNPLIRVDTQTRRLRFFVIYVPCFTGSGFNFKVLSRQIGENGHKMEGGKMIDFVVNDFFTGRTIDNISCFFEKWILVDSGLRYTYQGHVNVNEDSVNIAKWLSWFDDVKEIVPLNSMGLDSVIAALARSAQVSDPGSNSEPSSELNSEPALRHFPGKKFPHSKPALFPYTFNSFTSDKGLALPPLKSLKFPSTYDSHKRMIETFGDVSSCKRTHTVSPVTPITHATPINPIVLVDPVHLNSVVPLNGSAEPVYDTTFTSNDKSTCAFVPDLSTTTTQAVDSSSDFDLSSGLPFLSASWIDEHSDVWGKL